MSDCLHCVLGERSEFCWWLKKERKKESEEERGSTKPGLGADSQDAGRRRDADGHLRRDIRALRIVGTQ